ncbi:hypothetical protein GMA19_01521 [Paenibacillus polymyxa E681]|uniref:hypothetical protein n=1 Tax=Paenibacillus polymyxa TaxID=1406 RepID=UPI0001E317A2|nr:hypothetical protein [Paenibacillus polymyxa]ADM69352.1 hypothetical protein PPE_01513 [Paenibacillus polymyxa E681]QNV56360.1 hypothetical protein GE561_01521 [Paenibacillus polymyxa E681]QNV61197.1 hypothetical protein GMA19_01521 [Paenibacillus polymyxa E681]
MKSIKLLSVLTLGISVSLFSTVVASASPIVNYSKLQNYDVAEKKQDLSKEEILKSMPDYNPKLEAEYKFNYDNLKDLEKEAKESPEPPSLEEMKSVTSSTYNNLTLQGGPLVELARTEIKLQLISPMEVYGLNYSANMLNWSLQDNPGTYTRLSNSGFSTDLKNTVKIQNILDAFKTKLSSVSGTSYSVNNSVGLTTSNSTQDFYLALHNVNYEIAANKSNGRWDIQMYITDKYDFAYQNITSASGFKSAFVRIVNNYAQYYQTYGAIVPYNVRIFINDSK